MSQPFMGEVRMLPYSFAPRSWAYCEGGTLSIGQNTALFSILGTTYGGDGRATFKLPDLAGRAPMHPGSGPGLARRRLGWSLGLAGETLSGAEMAKHDHTISASYAEGDSAVPTDNMPGYKAGSGKGASSVNYYINSPDTNMTSMSMGAVSGEGSGQAHENRQPFLCTSFCICIDGLYPPRN